MSLALKRLAGKILPRLIALADGVELRDCFVFGGLGMVGYGAYSIYPPAGWIVVGAVLFWIGGRG